MRDKIEFERDQRLRIESLTLIVATPLVGTERIMRLDAILPRRRQDRRLELEDEGI